MVGGPLQLVGVPTSQTNWFVSGEENKKNKKKKGGRDTVRSRSNTALAGGVGWLAAQGQISIPGIGKSVQGDQVDRSIWSTYSRNFPFKNVKKTKFKKEAPQKVD